MSRWPGPQGIVGAVQRILSDGVPSVATERVDIEQAADDGTDGLFIAKADGTVVGEFFHDGSNFKIETASGTNDDIELTPDGRLILGGNRVDLFANLNVNQNAISSIGKASHQVQDVTAISSPSQGDVAYHDGSGSETVGPAHFDGTDWISIVDGTTITNP